MHIKSLLCPSKFFPRFKKTKQKNKIKNLVENILKLKIIKHQDWFLDAGRAGKPLQLKTNSPRSGKVSADTAR